MIKWVGAAIVLFSSIAVLLMLTSKGDDNAGRKALIKKGQRQQAKPTPAARYNLYDLKHDFLTKGHRLNEEKKYDSAIIYYLKASEKFEKERDWENYVWVNGYIGRLYLYVQGLNYDDALPYLQKAYQLGKQRLSSHHPYMASIYYYLGMYCYYTRNADSSLQMQDKALEILEKNLMKESIYAADVYECRGNVYAQLLFDNALAESNFIRSVKIKESFQDKDSRSGLTSSYYGLIHLSNLTDNYQKAETYCYEALKNVQYVKGHTSGWIEIINELLAEIYGKQLRFEKAINTLNNLLVENKKNHFDQSYLPVIYLQIGNIYRETAKYDTAVWYYQKALALTASGNALFDNPLVQAANTYYALGMTFTLRKDYKAALFNLNRCLVLRLKIYGKKHRETVTAMQGIGRIYQLKNMPDSALKYFQEALAACIKNSKLSIICEVPHAADIDNSFHSFEVIRDKASILLQLADKNPADSCLLSASFGYYCLADTLMALFSAGYKQDNEMLSFHKNTYGIYEEALDCVRSLYQRTHETRYCEAAFDFMDKGKAGLLLAAIYDKAVLEQAGIPPDEQETLRSLKQGLVFLQSQLEQQKNDGNAEEAGLRIIHARIRITEAKLNALQEKLQKNYPYYASLHQKGDSVHLKEVQAFCCRNNVAVLEYFWGDKAVYILGTYQNRSQLFKIARSNELDENIQTLQFNLARGYIVATSRYDFASFQRSSYFAYDALVKPVLHSLLGEREITNQPGIVFIPDGPLYRIPMEVLLTEKSIAEEPDYQKLDYLINSFTISYGYSARLLLANYNYKNPGRQAKVLGMGFSKDQVPKADEDKTSGQQKYSDGELPGTALELQAIAQYMRGRYYTGDGATEQLFKKEAAGYDILHLAVHGKADSLNLYSSRLIFKKGNDSANDGNLYNYEVYTIPMKAKLAVLSGCESGIGKLNPREGMYSMARGFMFAGCPSLIISYWKINDMSSAWIMADLYKQLSEGLPINQSVRKAKLDYIISRADRRSAHPANWAAFVALGNMTPIEKAVGLNTSVLLVFLAVITLMGIGAFAIKRI